MCGVRTYNQGEIMFEREMVTYAAPTLAGIKTGSLFRAPCTDTELIRRGTSEFNRKYASRGAILIPLRCDGKGTLMYLCRPNKLKVDISDVAAAEILEAAGYRSGRCLSCLVRRFRECVGFPHEIGIFLSYPPCDVKGFIENGAKDCKACGFWKVYGDVESAEECFRRYRICTAEYKKQWAMGKPLDRLLVAV